MRVHGVRIGDLENLLTASPRSIYFCTNFETSPLTFTLSELCCMHGCEMTEPDSFHRPSGPCTGI